MLASDYHFRNIDHDGASDSRQMCSLTGSRNRCLRLRFSGNANRPVRLCQTRPPARKWNIPDFAKLSCSDLSLDVLFAFHKLEGVKAASLVVDSEKLPAR
jgi:hypothetical protein